jgi:hypothetical protein
MYQSCPHLRFFILMVRLYNLLKYVYLKKMVLVLIFLYVVYLPTYNYADTVLNLPTVLHSVLNSVCLVGTYEFATLETCSNA